MSQAKALPQSKDVLLKQYQKRLKDDIRSMVDNYMEIIKSAKIEEDSQILRQTSAEQDQYEMQVRAANIVRAGESLMKLVSDIKQFLILNDFVSVNESITQNTQKFLKMQMDCDNTLHTLRDDMAADLYDLEDEYYSSTYK